MKTFLSTVIGGTIGITALYLVGKIAYCAGVDVGRAEAKYEYYEEKVEIKPRKKKLFDLNRLLDGREIKVSFRPKEDNTR